MGRKLSPRQMEIYRRTDEILHYLWDPIGIKGAAGARDEYHGYLPKVSELLNRNADNSEIATYLIGIEADRMGLTPNRGRIEVVVEKLRENREWVIDNPDRWPDHVPME